METNPITICHPLCDAHNHVPTVTWKDDYRNTRLQRNAEGLVIAVVDISNNNPADVAARGFRLYPGETRIELHEGYAELEPSYDGTTASVKIGYGSHGGSAGLTLNDARTLRALLSDMIADMERRQAWYGEDE